MTDAELDRLFQDLPRPAVPAELDQRVLAGYRDLRRQEQWRRWGAGAFAIAAAAVALVVLSPAPLPVGNLEEMTPRGVGERVARLRLEAAVQQGSQTERLSVGRSYPAGSTLIFKASAEQGGKWVLKRNGVIIGAGELRAGDTVLPVGYTLEQGEGEAVFQLQVGEARSDLTVPAVAP